MNDVRRFAIAARVFTLVAITSTALVGNVETSGVGFVAAIAVVAELLSVGRRVPESMIAVVEAVATAFLAASSFPDHEAAFPYLATPALIAGIAGGLRSVGTVLAAEAIMIGGYWAIFVGHYDSTLAGTSVTWLTTGLGLGLLGTFTRRNVTRSGTEASYRNALDLIKQLHALSGKLTSGLDPVDIADQALAAVAEEIVVRQSAVLLRQSGEFTPLRYSHGPLHFAVHDADAMLHRCWQSNRPVLGGSRVALPMSTESERVAVVLVDCAAMPDAKAVERAMERLASATVRLNAALLFSSVRESATSEERRRLAREVHDGVAQDVASLGYLVDNLAATATETDQVEAVGLLRREVTRVVAELRNSVFDLRNETDVTQGLGESIASFARHIGSHSPLRVHVSLDESTIRLRPRVEAELLRIAQEAINNARRHSEGENLWVECMVQPPRARIEIVDDGVGLGSSRDDSHGLRIMSERAERIGAEVEVTSPAFDERGTRIVVRLG
jgi:signal transduction histidine kinase